MSNSSSGSNKNKFEDMNKFLSNALITFLVNVHKLNMNKAQCHWK